MLVAGALFGLEVGDMLTSKETQSEIVIRERRVLGCNWWFR